MRVCYSYSESQRGSTGTAAAHVTCNAGQLARLSMCVMPRSALLPWKPPLRTVSSCGQALASPLVECCAGAGGEAHS